MIGKWNQAEDRRPIDGFWRRGNRRTGERIARQPPVARPQNASLLDGRDGETVLLVRIEELPLRRKKVKKLVSSNRPPENSSKCPECEGVLDAAPVANRDRAPIQQYRLPRQRPERRCAVSIGCVEGVSRVELAGIE